MRRTTPYLLIPTLFASIICLASDGTEANDVGNLPDLNFRPNVVQTEFVTMPMPMPLSTPRPSSSPPLPSALPTPRPFPPSGNVIFKRKHFPWPLLLTARIFGLFEQHARAETIGVSGASSNSYKGPKPNLPKLKVSEKVIEFPVDAAAWEGDSVADLDRARKIMKAICALGNSVDAPYANPGTCSPVSDGKARGALACTGFTIVAGDMNFPGQGVVAFANSPLNTKVKFPDGMLNNLTHNVTSSSVFWTAPTIPEKDFHAEIEIRIQMPSLNEEDKEILNSINPRLLAVAEAQIKSILTHEKQHVQDFRRSFMETLALPSVVQGRLSGKEFLTNDAKKALEGEFAKAYAEVKKRFADRTAEFHKKEVTPERDKERGMAPIPLPGFEGFQCDGAATAFMMPKM